MIYEISIFECTPEKGKELVAIKTFTNKIDLIEYIANAEKVEVITKTSGSPFNGWN